ncbi:biotin--[acetyl-CoA-carboxylase] ligase [Peribacillus saganii]|uniref:Bifunctional ligase/repressor BirA n=1 Tax=Peribacillus saganii TaxID=2303992 RepID=A0A372LME9_9BACI|nr:biotin--[acetyl-CoA-carboxylase] ligase [Peribacillus saganii]RFU68473.1 biotin--[acetyl-CoA-carboxylase] ligase [Peribacillus saganii]
MESNVKMKLIEAFSRAAEGDFVSGQEIAEVIGCSRTAVWKHIEELRKEGYELDAVRKKGYRIVSAPEKVTKTEIQIGLGTNRFGKEVVYEETVSSTQQIAHRLANEGASEGTIVVAEEQVSGKGRLSRSWHSPKFTGIWMSIILRPIIPIDKAPQLTLLAAVAVVQAIEEVTDTLPQIKWPNDILINGKKVTGILTEMQAESDGIHSVIIGIGINVNTKQDDFPDDLKEKATSIQIEQGKSISRAKLIQVLLLRLEKIYDLYLEKGFSPIKQLWEGYAVTIGRDIIATTLTGTITGRALGITEEGVLLLEDNKGEVHKIYSADISLA